MKVLFDHRLPFHLAHGGLQIQIEQTMRCLEEAGIEVEALRWWDQSQSGDLIHFFGRPDLTYLDFAHRKGIRVLITELLSGLGSRKVIARTVQRAVIGISRRLLPRPFAARMSWDAYKQADACVANTSWEARLMVEVFDAPSERVHVVPNGVEEIFFQTASEPRGKWLVCTAVIDPRKCVLELASAAVRAEVPLWVIGKPYVESDPYYQSFIALAKSHPNWVRYEGPITNREAIAQAYRQARGFVLLSTMETRSLSSEEAAAAGCPLLLSDLPWAKSVFGPNACYCPVPASPAKTAAVLREFYEGAPAMPTPPAPCRWSQIAQQYISLYQACLAR